MPRAAVQRRLEAEAGSIYGHPEEIDEVLEERAAREAIALWWAEYPDAKIRKMIKKASWKLGEGEAWDSPSWVRRIGRVGELVMQIAKKEGFHRDLF